MTYASWIKDLSLEFWLSAIFGSVATILYAINEFARPTFQQEDDKPETSFAPAELTRGSDYLVSFCIYLAGLLAFYWLVCFIGPVPFTKAGLTSGAEVEQLQTPGAFPLWVAMILIGVLPRLPVLCYFEQSWRKLMHTHARIPQAVLLRSSDLRRAEYSFEAFEPLVRKGEGMFARNVSPADLEAPPTTASHRWARLSAILQQISFIDVYPNASHYVDTDFIDRHRTILSAIAADYFRLADMINRERRIVRSAAGAARLEVVGGVASDQRETVTAHGTDGIDPKAVSDEHSKQIEALLRRTCLFLSCSMLASPHSVRSPDAAMRAFGFQAVPATEITSEIDVVIKSVILALFAYCVFVFVAFAIGDSLPAWMGEAGWPLPGEGNDRLQFIFNFTVPQIVSIVGALMLRHAFRGKLAWFRHTLTRPALPYTHKYVGLFVTSFILALATSSYLAGTWQGAEKIFSDLYWRFFEGFVPATSAVLVCLAIDGVIVGWDKARRVAVAVLHAVVATVVAFGAAEHFYTNTRGLDFSGAILYSTLGTLAYASALAVAVLFLASRSALLNEVDDLATA